MTEHMQDSKSFRALPHLTFTKILSCFIVMVPIYKWDPHLAGDPQPLAWVHRAGKWPNGLWMLVGPAPKSTLLTMLILADLMLFNHIPSPMCVDTCVWIYC